MPNKMLIDATHPEETRVVVLRGNRVEEFDFEAASRRQLRGNIYLAKVTRVEPSLQAAFVDYGGNRHGFLAFSEIHPDYYQIPVADRQALIDEEERAHRDAEAEADRRAGMRRPRHRPAARGGDRNAVSSPPVEAPDDDEEHIKHPGLEPGPEHEERAEAAHLEGAGTEHAAEPSEAGESAPAAAGEHGYNEPVTVSEHRAADEHSGAPQTVADAAEGHQSTAEAERHDDDHGDDDHEDDHGEDHHGDDHHGDDDHDGDDHHGGDGHETEHAAEGLRAAPARERGSSEDHGENGDGEAEEEEIVESVGGADAMEEVPDRTPRPRRQYKIQEVIKRRQVMLVQVVKEERGTKGAALTTYLSLAGRYSVLMPNTARGGGISRKITNVQDRKRLKEIAGDLEVPEGMGVILRTAGAARTKLEIKRDFEYLLRAWETVRDLTLKSTAPTLVYEEGSLVKRSIRDLYNKEIDEVIVAGDDAYRDARDFMRMLMPSHAKNVKPYRENQPLLARYGIEAQLDAMFSPVVQLRSGGYIVLNQTEALVAIDVNSGRATREHHIEDTALKTNLEASEEVARQLRLRDLAGLIVIDFIDMDEKRNNRAVERRIKECLKNDRARIQVGRISHFGLLEMSRQRIRTSVLESSTDKCPHCGGTGHVRSVSSVALQCLRMIEEQLQRGATHNLTVRTRPEIALYVLNHKRPHLYELERRYQITITVSADPGIAGQQPFNVEKGELVHSMEQARTLAAQWVNTAAPLIEPPEEDFVEEPIEDEIEAEAVEVEAESDRDEEDAETGEASESAEAMERGENGDGGRRRRRRRRRGGRRDEQPRSDVSNADLPASELGAADRAEGSFGGSTEAVSDEDDTEADDEEAVSGEDTTRASGAPNGNGDGDRRRRRRGRRGGRRNRREDGEGRLTPPEFGAAPIDEEVMAAAADFGGPPVEHIPHAVGDYAAADAEVSRERAAPRGRRSTPPPEASPPPVAVSAAPAVAEPAAPEPVKESPRRRSTVREPVPFLVGGTPTPPPAAEAPAPAAAPVATAPAAPADAPAAPQSASDAPAAPRRAGWWAKRIFGEKG